MLALKACELLFMTRALGPAFIFRSLTEPFHKKATAHTCTVTYVFIATTIHN